MKKRITYLCLTLAILLLVPLASAYAARSIGIHSLSVGRTVGSAAKRYIERLSPESKSDADTDSGAEKADGEYSEKSALARPCALTKTASDGSVKVYLATCTSRTGGLESIMLLCLDSSDGALRVVELPTNADLAGKGASVRSPEECMARALQDSPESADRQLSQFIEQRLGVSLDGYFSFPQEMLPEAVDAVGGVTLKLSSPLSIAAPDGERTLGRGAHTLDGRLCARALESADAQSAHLYSKLLFAIGDKIRDRASLPSLLRIYNTLSHSMRSDLTPGDLLGLAPVFIKGASRKPEVITFGGSKCGDYRTVDIGQIRRACAFAQARNIGKTLVSEEIMCYNVI